MPGPPLASVWLWSAMRSEASSRKGEWSESKATAELGRCEFPPIRDIAFDPGEPGCTRSGWKEAPDTGSLVTLGNPISHCHSFSVPHCPSEVLRVKVTFLSPIVCSLASRLPTAFKSWRKTDEDSSVLRDHQKRPLCFVSLPTLSSKSSS